MYKVLVSDKFSEKGLEIFKDSGNIEVDYTPGLSPEELLDIIDKYDALVVRSKTKPNEQVIDKASNLKVIGRAGVGVDNIDLAAATRSGICVMNTPGGNNRTAAEHTISMMLAMSRNIPQADKSLKGGKWEKPKFIGTEVLGKTLGVIGLGNIGRVVASLGKGLNMKVLGFDPFISDEAAEKLGIKKVDLNEVFKRSDYVTVHVPKNEKTVGLIDAEAIAKMKDGVRILNCARGGIVDEDALLSAMESGKVRGAALDVFTAEPPGEHPLLKRENVIATPHLGASTTEAQDNVAIMVAEQIIDFLNTGTIVNSVNVPSLSPEQHKVLAPYLEISEKLGSMLGQLCRKAPVEIEILYGGDATALQTDSLKGAMLEGFMSHIAEVEVNPINAVFLASERGIEIVETKRKSIKGFDNLIGVTAVFKDDEEIRLQAAKMGAGDLRLVGFNGLFANIEFAENMLIIKNKDLPGVVGEVGTLLGKAGINIANLRLARKKEGGTAVLIVSIDTPVSSETISELCSSSNIIDAWLVKY